MEQNREEIVNSGVTAVGSDAASEYHVAPRSEIPAPVTAPVPSPILALYDPHLAAAAAAAAATSSMPPKKKRGRPRKYNPDGGLGGNGLSPTPISTTPPARPPAIDFSAQKRPRAKQESKKNEPAAANYANPPMNVPMMNVPMMNNWSSFPIGDNFTGHTIHVEKGQDISARIISFCQRGRRNICILSATGLISTVTLRLLGSYTHTYSGQFELVLLSGSFTPAKNEGPTSKTGGMSIMFARPDGGIVGGGVAGVLVAATRVQVMLGSFDARNEHEQKPKNPAPATPEPAANPKSEATPSAPAAYPKSEATPSSFRGDTWSVPAAYPKSEATSSSYRGGTWPWNAVPNDSKGKQGEIKREG
ncbi:AT-hook motif nuclear-localized protein 1 [Linum perenne]